MHLTVIAGSSLVVPVGMLQVRTSPAILVRFAQSVLARRMQGWSSSLSMIVGMRRRYRGVTVSQHAYLLLVGVLQHDDQGLGSAST